MQLYLSNFVEAFKRKGISFGMLPRLIEDIEVFLASERRPSLHQLNIELEDLGWGIGIIDPPVYDRILQMHPAAGPKD